MLILYQTCGMLFSHSTLHKCNIKMENLQLDKLVVITRPSSCFYKARMPIYPRALDNIGNRMTFIKRGISFGKSIEQDYVSFTDCHNEYMYS